MRTAYVQKKNSGEGLKDKRMSAVVDQWRESDCRQNKYRRGLVERI